MSDTITEVAPVTAPVATPEPVAPAESVTLKDHEQRYGPNGSEPGPDDDDGPLDDVVDEDSKRHRGSRAKSKQAAARINKLVAERHELRQRLEALESKSKQPVTPEPQPVYRVPDVPPVDFTDPEPTLEQFADKDDPYGAWQRELARWDRRKEAAEETRIHMEAQQRMMTQQAGQYWEQARSTHQQRLIEAVRANPAHAQALQSVQVAPPPLLDWTIMLDNQSADVALFLATHPAVLDEFVLMTAAQPVTEQTVAVTRRLLRQRMAAAPTGSVAPAKLPNPPPPPNPVRTGALRATDAPPADDSMSLAAHERFFGKGGKRR